MIDIGYNIAPAIASSVPSCEPSDELQENSYINLQPPTSLTFSNANDNVNIDMTKKNFFQTAKIQNTSISDMQVIHFFNYSPYNLFYNCLI